MSTLFQREILRSERIRVLGILSVLAAVAVFFIARVLIAGNPSDDRLLLNFLVLLGLMAGYEVGVLTVVQKRLREGASLPTWFWILNIVVESLLPTAALFILTESELFGPYRALTAPVVLSYFFFITLSTLRLNPWLARLTGLVSAAGYSSVMVYTMLVHPLPQEGSLPIGQGLYLTYVVFLLFGGWIAGAVAGQIRRHASVALDEALRNDRVRRDLDLARTIQQGLLPKAAPNIAGFDIAGWNLPADQTGGDFYHWESMPDGRLTMVVADVTGHGIGPALIASLSRAYGRAGMAADGDPGSSMTRLDTLLTGDLPSGKLVNYILAVLDPGSSRVALLSAGQGPLLVYRVSSKTVESFNAHGVPLGVGLGVEYGPAQQVDLAAGDMLILMTDGFHEWENRDGEQFGLQRLNETVCRTAALPADEIISTLYADVLQFADGSEQQDDLTAVIVKRGAAGTEGDHS